MRKPWLLSKVHPAGLAAVQRFEADSKFFRSFAVALVVLALFYLFQGEALRAAVCTAAVVPALWRYVDQRFKATQQAYWFVITLEGAAIPAALPRADGPTHAGVVVYRIVNGAAEFLLVQASRNKDQWVLPKGYIEPGEDPRETAVREVHEETGIWARTRADLGSVSFSVAGSPVVSQCYLMEWAGRGERKEKRRHHRWSPY